MKYFTPISIVLIITLIAASILMPGWVNVIAGVAVAVGLSIVISAVVQKHIGRRNSQPVNKLATARIIFIEITGILLAMLLAGLLGRVVSQAATKPINNELTKLVLGIIIGACIGLGTGLVFRRAWGRLAGIVSER
jgi:hypothetical protein